MLCEFNLVLIIKLKTENKIEASGNTNYEKYGRHQVSNTQGQHIQDPSTLKELYFAPTASSYTTEKTHA